MTTAETRRAEAAAWLCQYWQINQIDLQPASSDASFRRYYRAIYQNQTFIIMDAPPPQENCAPWVALNQNLAAWDIGVPRIFNYDLARGFILMSDLGNQTVLNQLNQLLAQNNTQKIQNLYQNMINIIIQMQKNYLNNNGVNNLNLPCYDVPLLRRELHIFREWYLEKHLAIQFTESQEIIWEKIQILLIDNALNQTQTFVHRDFHSRNVMFNAQDQTQHGVIDFQDAVIGPVSYDLVSLLRDCYIAWSPEMQTHLLKIYYNKSQENNILNQNFEDFHTSFDFMGMQRHLKAIGIFARLNYRDGKPDYLKDIPRTKQYILDVIAKHQAKMPILGEFSAAFLP